MTIMGRPSLCDATDKSTDRVSIGHVKLHYHDHDLPSLETLTQEIEEAHAQGRGVASHCVTHGELMLTLAAIEAAGPSKKDRIEHAAIVTQDALDWIKQLNIGVVTQPNFIVARERHIDKILIKTCTLIFGGWAVFKKRYPLPPEVTLPLAVLTHGKQSMRPLTGQQYLMMAKRYLLKMHFGYIRLKQRICGYKEILK